MSREVMQQALDALIAVFRSHQTFASMVDPYKPSIAQVDAWHVAGRKAENAIAFFQAALAEQPAHVLTDADRERYLAIREAEEYAAESAYFEARKERDKPLNRTTYEAGFKAGYDCAFAAAIPPGSVVVPVEPSEEQVDATRQILLYYDTQGRTYEGLRHYLDCVGVKYKSWCPEWFKTETGHMTKGGTAILVYAAMLAARPGEPI